MYNSEKFRYGKELRVKDLIAELAKENPNAFVSIGGGSDTYIHVDTRNNVVMLDYEECYDDMDKDIEDIRRHKIVTQDQANNMLKVITEHLIMNDGKDNIRDAYNQLGFNDEEIMPIYPFTEGEENE